ncbi:MAG: hypothetical protein ABEI78_01185 [Candidatus Nanohaloarchaea archaeon]
MPWYNMEKMEEARTQPLWKEETNYTELLKDGRPDVGVITGAPRPYEEGLELMGAETDLKLNEIHGNKLENTTIIIPEELYEKRPNLPETLEEHQAEVIKPDYSLETTLDDFKTVDDITSKNDTVHAYTTDYHAPKTDATGYTVLSLNDDRNLQTFGFDTSYVTRENPLKNNKIVQTLDTPRQIYKGIKEDLIDL